MAADATVTRTPGVTSRAREMTEDVRAWAGRDRLATLAIAVGVVLRFLYWEITDRKFEDGLITVTHARSVVDGIGLTHHAGEPVTHGFTSAISVLVPLVGELLGTFVPKVDGFMALHLASLAAFVLTIIAASELCTRLGVATWPRAFVLLFLAVDYKQIFYGMAGMETQMAVAILLWSILATMDRASTRAGILYALCFLVRPDFGLFVFPALIGWFLLDRRTTARTSLITLACMLPWVIFTTAYYGSPIPNTIKAKALRYHTEYPSSLSPHAWWEFISQQVSAREAWWHTFTPFLENGFVTEAPLLPFFSAVIAAVVLGLGIVGVAATRSIPGWRPAVAFLLLFTLYRMVTLPSNYYEWYYPPFTALLVICGGVALTRLAVVGPKTTRATAFVLVALFAWPLPALFTIDRRIQKNIEDQVRLPMGLWIRDNVPKGASLTSESAGYVGYYGRPLLYDYPGLTSKHTLAIMKKLGWQRNSMSQLVNAARPDYVVWRPNELDAFNQEFPQAAAQYKPVKSFSVPPAKSELTWHGTSYINIDRDFVIVRRNGAR
jgi:hypothetical protein